MPSKPVAIEDLSGRPLGARAQRTRRLILAATQALLEERGLRELRVADIARRVATSPATFYQYFADVEAVVLDLAAQANAEIPALLELFEGTWRRGAGEQRARAVVDFFMQYWDRYGCVLRIRNLSAEEGDERFMALRGAEMRPILAAMVAQMERNGALQRNPKLVPGSAALAMCAVLDRMAANHKVVEQDGFSLEELASTSAEILFRTLTGK